MEENKDATSTGPDQSNENESRMNKDSLEYQSERPKGADEMNRSYSQPATDNNNKGD